jgi:hypothetical protein
LPVTVKEAGVQLHTRYVSFLTYAVVASFVELSPALCVVAIVPLGNAGVPLKFAAVPVMFAAFAGMSPLTKAGSCACGNVPVIRSDALSVTLEDSACPFTVTEVETFDVSLGCTWSARAQLVLDPTAPPVPSILGVVEPACNCVTTWLGDPAFAEI